MSTNKITSAEPTQDERIMAALSHVSILLPMMGAVAPIVIWATQKDKSRYVAFQALQATVYQLGLILAWFTGMACYMCSFFGMFAGMLSIPAAVSQSEELSDPIAFFTMLPAFLPFIVLGFTILGGIAYVLYGFIGAVQVFRGVEFRYIVIGNRLERYLEQGERANNQREDSG